VSSCVLKPSSELTFSLQVTSNNVLVLTFSAAVNLTLDSLTITVEGSSGVSYVLEQQSAYVWNIILDSSLNLTQGGSIQVDLNPGSFEGYQIPSTTATGTLQSQSAPSTSEEQTAQVIGQTSQAAATTAVAASTAAGFSTGSMTSAWAMINSIQMIGYIPMMDIDLPLALSEFFKSVLDFNLIPNLFQYFVHDSSAAPPSRVQRVGTNSSLFILNAGQTLVTFLMVLSLWPVFCLLSRLKNHKVAGYFYDAAGAFKWNYFIRFFIEGYLDLFVAAVVQLNALSLGSVNFGFNAVLAVIVVVLCALAPIVSGTFILNQFHRFKDDSDVSFHKKWGSLFSEFKNDRGWVSSSFYVIFFTRRLGYVVLMFYLENYPIAQTCMNITHSALTAIFLLIFRPFKETAMNISTCYSELCITFTFGLCGVFILDLSSSSRLILQWVVLGVVYSMILVNFAVSVFLSIRDFRELWRTWRERLQRNRRSKEEEAEDSPAHHHSVVC
jgi:hypothetical protein